VGWPGDLLWAAGLGVRTVRWLSSQVPLRAAARPRVTLERPQW